MFGIRAPCHDSFEACAQNEITTKRTVRGLLNLLGRSRSRSGESEVPCGRRQCHQTDNNQVERDNVTQQLWHHEYHDAGEQRHDRRDREMEIYTNFSRRNSNAPRFQGAQ